MKIQDFQEPSAQNAHCNQQSESPAGFCTKLISAVARLKYKLQRRYETDFPDYVEQIRNAVAEAEELAWETAFPQLLLPEFAEARVAARLADVNLNARFNRGV